MVLVGPVALAQLVSIHAPAKGATLPPCFPPAPDTGFDPRPREGGDRPAP